MYVNAISLRQIVAHSERKIYRMAQKRQKRQIWDWEGNSYSFFFLLLLKNSEFHRINAGREEESIIETPEMTVNIYTNDAHDKPTARDVNDKKDT